MKPPSLRRFTHCTCNRTWPDYGWFQSPFPEGWAFGPVIGPRVWTGSGEPRNCNKKPAIQLRIKCQTVPCRRSLSGRAL